MELKTVEYYKNLDLADIKYFCDIEQIEKTEQWKDIEDFVDRYRVSDLGRIKSLDRFRGNGNGGYFMKGRIIRLTPDRDGYLLTGLRKPGVHRKGKVHRLVAIAFIPNPLNLPEVNHTGLYPDGKEGNKNDNRAISLKWDTRADNQKHASENGLTSQGEKHFRSKLTDKDITEIRSSNLKHLELSKIYNVSRPTITDIVNKKSWKHV